jgi:hypothetical protein
MTSTSSSAFPLNEKENGATPPPPAATNTNEGSQKTTKKTVKRIPWKAIDAVAVDFSDGTANDKITHPFLEGPNKLDLEIAKTMLVRSPYKTKHGRKSEVWEQAANELSQVMDGGSRIFGENGINVKQLKDRFDKLMRFVKNFQNKVNYRSGNDDDEAPCELLQALEDLYEEFDSFREDEKLCSKKSAAAREEERKKAETIRLASLGEMNYESREMVREARESKSKSKPPKTPPNGQYTSTPSSGESDLIQSMNERMSERIEIRKTREERKRQKLDVERERIALEQARFEVDRQDRDAARRAGKATMALLHKMAGSLLEKTSKK